MAAFGWCPPSALAGDDLPSIRCRTVEECDTALYTAGTICTQKDPRLGPLPPGWTFSFGDEDHEDEFDSENAMRLLYFKNVVDGKRTTFDPKMTSDELKARGVEIEDFIVV